MERETVQQRQIYEIIRTCKSHPTIQQVCTLVKEKNPSIGQATVYRAINRLLKKGKIKRIPLEDGYHYDVCSNHYHFQCDCCSKIEDLPFDQDLLEMIDHSMIPRIIDPEALMFHGLCCECKEKYENQ